MRTSLACLLLVIVASAQAQELGTLFHSPAERQALERLRRGESPEQAAINRADPVVTGYVKRSDGKSTVFLDNQPHSSRNERVQRLLEPTIVERYEPIPLTPEMAPAPTPTNSEAPQDATSPAPSKASVPKAKKPVKDD